MSKENKEVATRSANSSVTVFSEISNAGIQKRVEASTVEEIKQTLRYVFVLIGIRAEQIPEDFEKALLITFIQKRLKTTTLEEIKLAFEYAIIKRTEVNLTLFGEMFSSKTILEVVHAFKNYKARVVAGNSEVEHQTTTQKVSGFLDKLTPETLDHIKQIGKTDKKKRLGYEYYKEQAKNDPFQEYLREFDALHFESGITTNGFRFIIYGGSEMSPDNYCDYRAREVIFMSYEYLRSLKLDQTEFEKQVFFG